jgi:hypothetical protein
VTEKLSAVVRKALASPRQEIYALSRTPREARDELVADARDLHPDFAAVVEVKQASGQIRFKNGSVIRYFGGGMHSLEEKMRGRQPDYIDGIQCLPIDMQGYLRAAMADG